MKSTWTIFVKNHKYQLIFINKWITGYYEVEPSWIQGGRINLVPGADHAPWPTEKGKLQKSAYIKGGFSYTSFTTLMNECISYLTSNIDLDVSPLA
jgi:hypothetical protein